MYEFVHKHYLFASIILLICVFIIERMLGSWTTIGILIFVIIIAHRKSYTRDHEDDGNS